MPIGAEYSDVKYRLVIYVYISGVVPMTRGKCLDHCQENGGRCTQYSRNPRRAFYESLSDRLPKYTWYKARAMPEIGEVARIVNRLRKHLVGKTISAVHAVEDVIVFKDTTHTEFMAKMKGKKVVGGMFVLLGVGLVYRIGN